MNVRCRLMLAGAACVTILAMAVEPAGAALPGGVISKRNMEWVWNNPQVVGSDIEFFEELQADGSVRRYAITGAMGHGFQIIDITDPELPILAGIFVDPGVNWQGDPQVNPRRKIVSFATDNLPALTVGHDGVADGIALVDISDVGNPRLLSALGGLGGSHNSTIVDDRYIYTALPTHIVDYADPANPVDLGIPEMTDPANPDGPKKTICGHDITLDPNKPNRVYAACSGSSKLQIIDVSDPANPLLIGEAVDDDVSIAHQVDPAPDSSFLVLSDERGGGLSNVNAPGGGAHVWDISGKYTDGAASEANPIKIGIWFAPFNGIATEDDQAGTWGNVTIHNFTFQGERFLMSTGWYSMGSWVVDMQHPTNGTGPFQEWQGDQFDSGPTTWGNTQGHILLEADEVWSAKWTRFDDPRFDRFVFTNGLTRGMDSLFYTGGLPKKIGRLAVDAVAGFDPVTETAVITGKLDRFAVWTHQGWVNQPLGGKTLQFIVDGVVAGNTVTEADGDFALTLASMPGEHEVTASWAGNAIFQPASVTQSVIAEPRVQVDITDRVETAISNVSLAAGVFQFDLQMTNVSDSDFLSRLELNIIGIHSASGTVEVINADIGGNGTSIDDPAVFDYSREIGDDDVFSAGETTGSRLLQFRDERAELFTFEALVTAFERAGGGTAAASGATAISTQSSSGGDAGGTMSLMSFTVNPLTGAVIVELVADVL